MAHYEDPAFSVTEDSSLWTAYTYAAAQPLSSYADDPTFTLPTTDAPDDVFGGGGPYYTPEQGDGLGFDSYLDPTMLAGAVPTSRLHPPSPSPGLPPLSSADSTPSSSSALPTPYGPFEASPPSALGPSGLLLPSAPIGETSSSSRFAKLQESYLERQQQPQVESRVTEQVFANEPTSHALAYSTSAPPLTPSRRTAGPSATQLWRSPSSHSVNSSPTKSPYAHRPKPYDRPSFESPTKDLDSPSRTIVRRPSVSSYNSDDLLASPTKAGGGGRRQRANLSIDVPSKFGLRSRLPVIAASPQVPYTDGRFPSNPDAAGSEAELSESTLQQVENLLQEFGPMARSGAFDSSASSSSGLDSYASSSASNDTRYCISGVALSLEDMAQLDDPALTAAFDSVSMQQYPASAPPFQTSFNISEPPSPSPYNLSVPNSQHLTPSPSYVHDSYPSQQQPVFEKWTPSGYVASRTTHASFGSHIRSISAPRTAYYPTEDDLASIPLQNPTSHSLAQTYSTHSLPSHASPPRIPQTLRRRSSVASGSPSTSSPWSHAPPRPQQAFHSYSYGPPPASPSSASQQQHSPYHNIPLPLRPAPPLESTVDVSPPPSPTKPSKAKSKAPAPVPSGTPSSSTASSPTKAVAATSPKKRRAGGSRARNPSAMFVNFSAADAKKLLSGVAPSGSSKKKREEEEAAAAAAAAAARGGFSEPPESTFHEPLHAQAPQHQASATL